jgi:hypothetical protein
MRSSTAQFLTQAKAPDHFLSAALAALRQKWPRQQEMSFPTRFNGSPVASAAQDNVVRVDIRLHCWRLSGAKPLDRS